MATFDQLPGTLNLAFRAGDEFAALVDFSVSISNYSVTAEILSTITGQSVLPITTSIVDAASGQVNLALSETQTASLPPGTYRWILYWDAPGSVRRTMLSGYVEVAR